MEIVLGRIGHYFDAGSGGCQTAIVTQVWRDGADPASVNVAAWNHGGTQFTRSSVPIDQAPSADDEANSFHLAQGCPFGR